MIHYLTKKKVQNHLIALAPLAYYLRNQKYYTWDKILSIINFKHFYPSQNKPALIRIVKEFAKHHKLEPPLSHAYRRNMFISYNLCVLNMPLQDILRFQQNQLSTLSALKARISTLVKTLNLPDPFFKRINGYTFPAANKPNPEPILPVLLKTVSSIRVTQHSPTIARFKKQRLSSAPYLLHSPNRIKHYLTSLDQPSIHDLKPIDKAFLGLSLILKDNVHPKQAAIQLGYLNAFSLYVSISDQLKHCRKANLCPQDLAFSYKEFMALHFFESEPK